MRVTEKGRHEVALTLPRTCICCPHPPHWHPPQWATGGVNSSLASPTVPVVFIADGAHHIDLFYSDPADPPSVTAARVEEMDLVATWIAAWRAEQRGN